MILTGLFAGPAGSPGGLVRRAAGHLGTRRDPTARSGGGPASSRRATDRKHAAQLGSEPLAARVPDSRYGAAEALDCLQAVTGDRVSDWLLRPCSASTGVRGLTSASWTRGVLGQSGRTFSACGPFCPWVVSNSTFWFSSSDR